jgi:hypothetical protein
VDGNRTAPVRDVDGNRAGASRAGGYPPASARPGAARFERNTPSGGRTAPAPARGSERRAGGASRAKPEVNSMVRNNLPPGWGGTATPRRGGR